jgi:predicted HicB family RNase H-like nuclease
MHISQTFTHEQQGQIRVSKDKVINIRIDPEIKKLAKKLAADDQRSLSNWITWLIQREIKKSGVKK